MSNPVVRRLRAIAVTASALAVAALAATLAVGATAGADTPVRIDARQPMVPHTVARFNEARVAALLDRAPRSVGGRCVTTVDVPGQGDSCRYGDTSLWGVRLADGSTAVTHGPDVLAAGAPDVDSVGALGLVEAGDLTTNPDDSAFVTCATDARTPHYTAVYAQRYGATADPAAVRRSIRAALRQASAFTRAQSLAQGATGPVTMRFACDPTGTQIDVRLAPIHTAQSTVDFAELIAAVKATGVNDADTASSRMVIFSDQQHVGGAAGQGYIYPDDRPTVDNANNRADLVAVHYLINDPANPLVEWDVFAHEMFHNFGATQDLAPDANGEGHCDTDKDIMCYDEYASSQNGRGRAAGTPLPTHDEYPACSTTKLDCKADTYFNASASIPAGNYLSNHWNAGHPRNKWLDFDSRNLDTIAPPVPGAPRVTAATPTTLTVAWDAVADDRPGAVTYTLQQRIPGTGTFVRDAGTATSQTIGGFNPGSTVYLRVGAKDIAGNASLRGVEIAATLPATPPATDGGTTTTVPRSTNPGRPTIGAVRVVPGGANVSWSAGTGGAATTAYRITVVDELGAAHPLATPTGASSQFVPLKPGSRNAVSVIAVAATNATATSAPVTIAGAVGAAKCTWVGSDVASPTKPAAARAGQRARTSLRASFRPSKDANGICGYRLLRQVKGAWVVTGTAAATARVASFAKLPRNARVTLAVQAFDARGNLSARAPFSTRTLK